MPGEPTFRQKHEWARAHQSKPQAVSRDDADNGDDGIRWKQLLKGGATAAGGGANVILGAGATRVGFGVLLKNFCIKKINTLVIIF